MRKLVIICFAIAIAAIAACTAPRNGQPGPAMSPPVTDGVTSVIAMSSYVGALESPNATLGGSFGLAVDIDADFAVVGAPTADAKGVDSGAAFIYRLVPGSTNLWTQWRQLLPASLTTSNRFGRSVSLGEDFLAVGASEQVPVAGQSGAVYLYRRQQGGADNWGEWMRIAPTNLPGSSRFGYAVALHGDLLAVGAPDATLPGALGSFGYDDEGVPAQSVDIVRDGTWVGVLSGRDSAPLVGLPSGGMVRADGPGRLPMVRMTNVGLLPGESLS